MDYQAPSVAATCTPYVLGAVGDFASTRVVISRGGQEANPLQQGMAAQVGVQVGTAALGCWADLKLQRKGRKGLARALRIAVLALKVGLVVHNIQAR